MKRLIAGLALVPLMAWGQVNSGYIQGQVLTAASLNANFALAAAATNGVLASPTIGNPTITGGTAAGMAINSSPIGAGTPSTGAFTTVTGATVTGTTVNGTTANFTTLNGVDAVLTDAVTVNAPSAALIMNDTSGTGFPQFVYRSSGLNEWIVYDHPSTHIFTVNRYLAGVYQDAPFMVDNGTGAVTMYDGIVGSPISGSSGAFTSLSASGGVSGAGFTAYLSSPPPIGNTAPATGAFTTLSATGAFTPSQTAGIVGTTTNNDAAAGSWGEEIEQTGTATSLSSTISANLLTKSLGAGDWDVQCVMGETPNGSTVISGGNISVSTTSATTGSFGQYAFSGATHAAGNADVLVSPVVRVKLASSTPVYCVATVSFTVSTLTATGFLRARRVR